MGATTVLAKAPAHAPARASLAAVLGFFNLDFIIGGGVSFPCGGDDDEGGGVSGCGGCVGADATLMVGRRCECADVRADSVSGTL